MIRTTNEQINTKTYWNYIYNTPAKEKEYWERTMRFSELIKYVKHGDKFFDLGCGVGLPASMILEQRKDCEVWGLDISSDVIERNKKEMPNGKWFSGHVENLEKFPSNYFDVVFSGEVIEHLDNPAVLFKEAYRVLKKGGKLIITTPRDDGVESSEHLWYFSQDDIESFYFSTKFKDVKFVNLPDMEYMLVFFAIGEK